MCDASFTDMKRDQAGISTSMPAHSSKLSIPRRQHSLSSARKAPFGASAPASVCGESHMDTSAPASPQFSQYVARSTRLDKNSLPLDSRQLHASGHNQPYGNATQNYQTHSTNVEEISAFPQIQRQSSLTQNSKTSVILPPAVQLRKNRYPTPPGSSSDIPAPCTAKSSLSLSPNFKESQDSRTGKSIADVPPTTLRFGSLREAIDKIISNKKSVHSRFNTAETRLDNFEHTPPYSPFDSPIDTGSGAINDTNCFGHLSPLSSSSSRSENKTTKELMSPFQFDPRLARVSLEESREDAAIAVGGGTSRPLDTSYEGDISERTVCDRQTRTLFQSRDDIDTIHSGSSHDTPQNRFRHADTDLSDRWRPSIPSRQICYEMEADELEMSDEKTPKPDDSQMHVNDAFELLNIDLRHDATPITDPIIESAPLREDSPTVCVMNFDGCAETSNRAQSDRQARCERWIDSTSVNIAELEDTASNAECVPALAEEIRFHSSPTKAATVKIKRMQRIFLDCAPPGEQDVEPPVECAIPTHTSLARCSLPKAIIPQSFMYSDSEASRSDYGDDEDEQAIEQDAGLSQWYIDTPPTTSKDSSSKSSVYEEPTSGKSKRTQLPGSANPMSSDRADPSLTIPPRTELPRACETSRAGQCQQMTSDSDARKARTQSQRQEREDAVFNRIRNRTTWSQTPPRADSCAFRSLRASREKSERPTASKAIRAHASTSNLRDGPPTPLYSIQRRKSRPFRSKSSFDDRLSKDTGIYVPIGSTFDSRSPETTTWIFGEFEKAAAESTTPIPFSLSSTLMQSTQLQVFDTRKGSTGSLDSEKTLFYTPADSPCSAVLQASNQSTMNRYDTDASTGPVTGPLTSHPVNSFASLQKDPATHSLSTTQIKARMDTFETQTDTSSKMPHLPAFRSVFPDCSEVSLEHLICALLVLDWLSKLSREQGARLSNTTDQPKFWFDSWLPQSPRQTTHLHFDQDLGRQPSRRSPKAHSYDLRSSFEDDFTEPNHIPAKARAMLGIPSTQGASGSDYRARLSFSGRSSTTFTAAQRSTILKHGLHITHLDPITALDFEFADEEDETCRSGNDNLDDQDVECSDEVNHDHDNIDCLSSVKDWINRIERLRTRYYQNVITCIDVCAGFAPAETTSSAVDIIHESQDSPAQIQDRTQAKTQTLPIGETQAAVRDLLIGALTEMTKMVM